RLSSPARDRLRRVTRAAAAIVLSLGLAAAGCGHDPGTAPSRATGGIWRAIFATQASRARLQWQNAALGGGACRASLRRADVAFSALPDRETPTSDGCGIPY